ncbi:receptor-like protein EIX2 isoform X2 [Vigna unguiculata]|uniref:receptor-like protein EIX2 isoform X2 n=1 Tax=Vigna unguiculata TaxID=3917 RepID=UPI001016A5E1|nr:receptor-like protein EIX2 isoform X2 [Vigna unguiculata]
MDTSSSPYALIFACLLRAMMFDAGTCNFNNRCSEKDTQALLNFKKGIMDPSGVLSSWSTQHNCCEWKGVTCDRINNRVTHLSLPCFTTTLNYIDKEDKSHCLTGPHLPAWLYTQRSIQSLSIYGSWFQAPDKFWNFVSRVPELTLEDNSIVGNLSNILLNSTVIRLSSNRLKGSLPRLSPNAAVVSLSNNSLSGSISPLLCDHKMLNGKSNLVYLDISLNHLSGGLTNCWEKWKSLIHVNLGGNNLTGKIPPSMGLLSNLTSLHLHENKLYGEIPPSLQNCHILIFNVRGNNFTGNIPNWIPHAAKVLEFRSNHFSGSIPAQICQMSSLFILDIADNTISGHIPTCLCNITALNNVSHREFSSTTLQYNFLNRTFYFFEESLELVTKGLVLEYENNLPFMNLIDMSSNNLSGTIPLQMFSLIGLASLNLSHNKLTGKLPDEIGNMKNLESLDFSVNQFSGEIPEALSKVSFLGFLNLSFNNFTGKIPSGTQLQGFDAISYIGNSDLCGPPLTKICFKSSDDKSKDTKPIDEDGDKSEFFPWFHIGLESGFVAGFLGVFCSILLNRKWREA